VAAQGSDLLITYQNVACEFCGRTMLAGERAALLSLPGGGTYISCELCAPVARRRDWSRPKSETGRSGRFVLAEALSRLGLAIRGGA
jgi:hypothetical protein